MKEQDAEGRFPTKNGKKNHPYLLEQHALKKNKMKENEEKEIKLPL